MSRLARIFSAALVGAQMTASLAVAPASAQDLTHPRAMQLPEPAFQRPDPDRLRLQLDNGLVAYVAEDRRVPLVSITAYIGVGSGHGEPGEAEALAAALRRGPASMTADAFRAALDAMHAEYEVRPGHEEMQISLDIPAQDMARGLELMASVISAPAFEEAAKNQAASQAVAGGIDFSYSLQGVIDLFETRLFEGHVFRRSASDTVGNTGANAQPLHEDRVRGGNITLAVAGDFTATTARRGIQEAFGAVAEGSPEREQQFEPLAAREARSLLLSDAGRDQGWVVIGHELPVIPREDEAALHVMDYILGAYHLDSRLFRTSRELRGLTNDNSSFLQPGVRGPGSYSFRTYGRPEAVRLLVDVTFRQLELMRETHVTADELFVAKGALVDGIYAERYATGLDAANAYAVEWLREGSHEGSATYPDRVSAVTVEQVQAAARKYIHPERMIVAVVGPMERIRNAPAIEGEPQLEAFGN